MLNLHNSWSGRLTSSVARPVTFGGRKSNLTLAKEAALDTFNKPLIEPAHLDAWLAQFEPRDQLTAMRLVEQIRFVTPTDLVEDTRGMHDQLLDALAQDGFIETANGQRDFDNVDFSHIYTAKSGGLISYVYRKANRIPGDLFKTLGELEQEIEIAPPESKKDKALVILDDYICTGTQLLAESYAQEHANVFDAYQKIYVVMHTAHDKAIGRFQKIKNGQTDQVIQEIVEDFGELGDPKYDDWRDNCRKNIAKLGGGRVQLLYQHREIPFLSTENTKLDERERKKLTRFLEKYNVYKYPFGVGNAQGNTCYYYSAPNTMPDILWNKKSRRADGSPWLTLFERTEDLSIYSSLKGILPREAMVW